MNGISAAAVIVCISGEKEWREDKMSISKLNGNIRYQLVRCQHLILPSNNHKAFIMLKKSMLDFHQLFSITSLSPVQLVPFRVTGERAVCVGWLWFCLEPCVIPISSSWWWMSSRSISHEHHQRISRADIEHRNEKNPRYSRKKGHIKTPQERNQTL